MAQPKLNFLLNTGSGSGLSADLLDNNDSSFFTNAANISSGTLPSGRLSGTYSINISGNAATATSATSATNSSQLGGISSSLYALLASPAFSGTPTAPTQASNNNSTNLATTAFVQSLIGSGNVNFVYFSHSGGGSTWSGAVRLASADLTKRIQIVWQTGLSITAGGTITFPLTFSVVPAVSGIIHSVDRVFGIYPGTLTGSSFQVWDGNTAGGGSSDNCSYIAVGVY